VIYFFFINLEAGNDKNKRRNDNNEKLLNEDKSSLDDRKLKIKIPVIPYNQ